MVAIEEHGLSLRQRWIGALALSPSSDVAALFAELDGGAPFRVLRPAESGLVMVRARAGGTGQLFNTGEMTVTRCSVVSAQGTVGHAYVAGRDRTHAEVAARLDAVLQEMTADLAAPIVKRLEARIDDRARARQQRSAPTRVEFFTMVRGEDA